MPHLNVTSASQLGQDLWVLNRTGHKHDGFFVEFGAIDGIKHSNSYLLETRFEWRGICSEPHPQFFELLKRNRCCITDNACIAGATGTQVEFVLAGDLSGMQIHGCNDQHHAERARHYAQGDMICLTTISLEDFLNRHNAPRQIDYLSVDTEGSEFEILQAFPFDQWDIQLLTVEHNFTEQRSLIRDLMCYHGYSCEENQWDDCFFKDQ